MCKTEKLICFGNTANLRELASQLRTEEADKLFILQTDRSLNFKKSFVLIYSTI